MFAPLKIKLIPSNGQTGEPITEFADVTLSSSPTKFFPEPPPDYPTIPNRESGGFHSDVLDLLSFNNDLVEVAAISGPVSLALSLVPAQVTVPEPVTLALLGAGLVLVGLGRGRVHKV